MNANNSDFSRIADILPNSAFSGLNSDLRKDASEQESRNISEIKIDDANENAYSKKILEQKPNDKYSIIKNILLEVSEKLLNTAKLLDDNSALNADLFNARLDDLDEQEPIDGTIIEGVFDGEQMISADGNRYFIPPNYASKSKIVEGDLMKLTITKLGAYVYKQIGPTERRRIIGELVYSDDGKQFGVKAEGKIYKILKASVTFFKGTRGDEATILVPKEGETTWAAVENIKK